MRGERQVRDYAVELAAVRQATRERGAGSVGQGLEPNHWTWLKVTPNRSTDLTTSVNRCSSVGPIRPTYRASRLRPARTAEFEDRS
jgi:hypothetical protein